MTTTSFARGRLRVTHPETYRAARDRVRPRSLEGPTADDVHALIVNTLRDNGFVALQRVRLTQTAGPHSSSGAQPPATVSLALDLVEGEDALVLAESDGAYRWVRPRHEGARDATGARTAVFDLVLPAPPTGATGGANGGARRLGRRRPGAMRVTVLPYAVPLVAGAAIRALETFVDTGLVRVTGADPGAWTRVERLDQLGLDPARTHRALLLVHGTFDSTVGGFGGLTVTPEGRAFLARALTDYDVVLGYDHRTLSVDPLDNARDLAERLTAFPAQRPVTLDVVSHSRGGLVARSLVESVLPGVPWRGQVDRMVLLATPNDGTHLADPDRWGDLADVLTNLVAADARALADLPGGGLVARATVAGVRGLGALVRWLASFATDPESVPGLAAMVPGGPFVTALNADQPGQPRPGTPWFAVSSDVEVSVAAHPPELPATVVVDIVEGIVDRVIQGPNDLVVDVPSMSAVDLEHGGGYIRDTLAFGPEAEVYHTSYTRQPVVAQALGAWLLDRVDHRDGGAGTVVVRAVPPGRETAARRIPSRGRDLAPPPTADAEPPPRAEAEPPPGADEPPPLAEAEPPPGADEPPPDAGAGPPPAPAPPPPAPPPPVPATAPAAPAIQASMVAEIPQHPPVGVPTTVRIRVSRTALVAADGTASARTVLAVRPDAPVDVQVIPTKNCVLDSADLDRLLLPPGGGWAELQFTLRAVAAGVVRVKVLARQGRELLGSVTLEAEALDPAAVPGGPQALTRAQVEVASASSPVLADVAWLEIAQLQRAGETRFQYELRLPGHDERITGTSAPIQDVDAFVGNLFHEVQQLWFDCSDRPQKYLADLQDLGAHLFEKLFPQDFQAALWEHRDELDNLFLLADEPFIPWELVHLKPPVGPREQEPRFLGQLGLVRWQFTPFPATATLQARAGKVFSVCPEYADPGLNLAEVQAEAAYLTSTLGARTVAATEEQVRRLLRRRGGFDLLHFSGHGTADPGNIAEAKILLAGRVVGGALVSDYLSSTTVAENVRLAGRAGGSGPLVVLNACQVGRAGEDLTSLGGFARAFLEAGASAFVSCLWSVNQTPARIFVETFYTRLLAGDTVAAAALAARTAARAEGDATWLAYVVYARPDAVLVRG